MSNRSPARRWAAVVAITAVASLGEASGIAAQVGSSPGRKSPALALALSVVVPGAGQVYNGQKLKGALVFGGAALTAGPIILTASDVLGLDDDTSGTAVHVLGAAGVALILWSWIDAPRSAQAINRRLDAGGAAVEIGPRLEGPREGRGLGVSLLRMRF